MTNTTKKGTHIIIDGLAYPVTITNIRKNYGRIDYEVTPVNGIGTKWVRSSSIVIGEDVR